MGGEGHTERERTERGRGAIRKDENGRTKLYKERRMKKKYDDEHI